jgi:regulator of sirC expression with transglutaminase-like and TPR domain
MEGFNMNSLMKDCIAKLNNKSDDHPLELFEFLCLGVTALANVHSNVSPYEVESTINQFADEIKQRVKSEQPQSMFAHMHNYIYEEKSFKTSKPTHFSQYNIAEVFVTKNSGTSLMSAIYAMVALKLGMTVEAFRIMENTYKGYVILKVCYKDEILDIDPSSGGMLSKEQSEYYQLQKFMTWRDWLAQIIKSGHELAINNKEDAALLLQSIKECK